MLLISLSDSSLGTITGWMLIKPRESLWWDSQKQVMGFVVPLLVHWSNTAIYHTGMQFFVNSNVCLNHPNIIPVETMNNKQIPAILKMIMPQLFHVSIAWKSSKPTFGMRVRPWGKARRRKIRNYVFCAFLSLFFVSQFRWPQFERRLQFSPLHIFSFSLFSSLSPCAASHFSGCCCNFFWLAKKVLFFA